MLNSAHFQRRLLRWFDQHGRKNLPWQQHKTPYRVWVSEIMLQQTQVATVIPYFERFIQRFPDLASLAVASEDEVLHHWAGLGYYSRARNLHRAAREIVATHQGIFPDDHETLLTLPGIGASTANAILSIAFNQPAPILDGNVKRVFCRLYNIQTPINVQATMTELWEIATRHQPKQRAGDYTQALMDFGATYCTRRHPHCEQCPFQADCQAWQQQTVDQVPHKITKGQLPTRHTSLIIFHQQQQIVLYKRPATGIWGGLWSLPEIPDQPARHSLIQFCRTYLNIPRNQPLPIAYQVQGAFRHTFTHFHLMIHPIFINLPNGIDLSWPTDHIWYNLTHPQSIGMPKPVQTLIQHLLTADPVDKKMKSRKIAPIEFIHI